MAFRFEKSKQPKPAAKTKQPEQLDQKTSAYRDRAKRDQDRYKKAVDSRYWLCLCFRAQETRDKVAKALDADGEYAFGDKLREVAAEVTGPKDRFAPKNVVYGEDAPDPFYYMEESDGTVNGDALAMAHGLMSAFIQCKQAPSTKTVYSSPYHVTVIFEDRPDKESFVEDHHIAKYGYDYTDGDKVAEILGLL